MFKQLLVIGRLFCVVAATCCVDVC